MMTYLHRFSFLFLSLSCLFSSRILGFLISRDSEALISRKRHHLDPRSLTFPFDISKRKLLGGSYSTVPRTKNNRKLQIVKAQNLPKEDLKKQCTYYGAEADSISKALDQCNTALNNWTTEYTGK